MADNLAVGSIFSSFDEFRACLDEYCVCTNSVFVSKCAKTIDGHNKKSVTVKGKYPEEWRYLSVTFLCKHFGTYEGTSTGKRKVQETFKTGCTAVVKLSANKKKNGLVITEANLVHTGHAEVQTVNDAMVYPEKRKLTSSQAEEVKKLMAMKVSSAEIIRHIKETSGIVLSQQDVVNFRSKMRKQNEKSEETITEDIFQDLVAKDPGSVVKVIANSDSNEVEIIFVQTSQMRANFFHYPSMLFLDATYKVNNISMPLYTFMCVDGDHCGQVVGYGLVVNESINVVSKLIETFVHVNRAVKEEIKTCVVDKDFTEIRSLKLALPNVAVVLCKWHVERAIRRSLKGLSKEGKDFILTSISKMMHCSSEQEYNELLHALEAECPAYISYFKNHWDNCKQSWAGCYVRQHVTFGNLTNNFVESHNQKIKFLVSHYSSIPVLFRELLNFHTNKVFNTELKKSKFSLKKKCIHSSHPAISNVIHLIHQSCAPYSAKILSNQLENCFNKIFLVNGNEVTGPRGNIYRTDNNGCTCFVFQAQQLVCSHMFAFRRENELPLFLSTDVPTQHQLSRFLSSAGCDMPTENISVEHHQIESKPLNKNQKFRKASNLFGEMASILSEMGQKEFDVNYDMFRGILDAVKGGRDILFLIKDITVSASNADVQVLGNVESADSSHANSVMSTCASGPGHISEYSEPSQGVDTATRHQINLPLSPSHAPLEPDASTNCNSPYHAPLEPDASTNSNNSPSHSPLEPDASTNSNSPSHATLESDALTNTSNINRKYHAPLESDHTSTNSPSSVLTVHDHFSSFSPPLSTAKFNPHSPSKASNSLPQSSTLPNTSTINGVHLSSSTTQAPDFTCEKNSFKFPTKVRKRGRPKGTTMKAKNAKKRKLESCTNSDSDFLTCITAPGLVPYVIRGEILIDPYMLKKPEDIPDSILSISESKYRQYFSNSGWEVFVKNLIALRELHANL